MKETFVHIYIVILLYFSTLCDSMSIIFVSDIFLSSLNPLGYICCYFDYICLIWLAVPYSFNNVTIFGTIISCM
jgi:hypothetical protein